jgi:hypothetical protein
MLNGAKTNKMALDIPSEDRTCLACESLIPKWKNKHARYCSMKCSKRIDKERNYEDRGIVASNAEQGAISELLVSADLIKRGYEVFRALSPQSSCDLVALKSNETLRIEVRTGFLSRGGNLSYGQSHIGSGRYDVLAVALKDGSITYFLDIALESSGAI